MLITVAEKPHWGWSGTPFMNSTTGCSFTVSAMKAMAGFSEGAASVTGKILG